MHHINERTPQRRFSCDQKNPRRRRRYYSYHFESCFSKTKKNDGSSVLMVREFPVCTDSDEDSTRKNEAGGVSTKTISRK